MLRRGDNLSSNKLAVANNHSLFIKLNGEESIQKAKARFNFKLRAKCGRALRVSQNVVVEAKCGFDSS